MGPTVCFLSALWNILCCETVRSVKCIDVSRCVCIVTTLRGGRSWFKKCLTEGGSWSSTNTLAVMLHTLSGRPLRAAVSVYIICYLWEPSTQNRRQLVSGGLSHDLARRELNAADLFTDWQIVTVLITSQKDFPAWFFFLEIMKRVCYDVTLVKWALKRICKNECSM